MFGICKRAVETNQWIYKKEDMEVLINLGGELLRNITE